MKNSFAAFLFLLLLRVGAVSAQAPAPRPVPAARSGSAQRVMSTGISIPLFAAINKLPQLQPAEDSVDCRIFARNRVRSVTILRQIPGFGTGTSEHFELDRRGNKIRIDQAHGGQSRLQRFSKHNQPVELVMTAVPSFPISTRIVYDARTKVNSSYVTVRGGAPVLWQQAQDYRRGDTAITEAIFNAVPGLQTSEVRRQLMLVYPTGRDTLRVESIGYNQTDEPLDFSALYLIRRHGKTIENGHLVYPRQPGDALAKPKIPAAVLKLSRQQRPRYIPDTRNEYDERGQLIQRVALFEAGEAKAQTQTSTGSMTSNQPFSSLTTRYTRTPDGRVQRQDETYQLKPGRPPEEWLRRPLYTEYEYGANGLLLRKTDNRSNGKPSVYELKYTYY